MTEVVNIKFEECDVYIGRSSDPIKGKWGNPFSHKHNTLAGFKTDTREEAIEMYRKWITEGEGKHLLDDLHLLVGKKLGCWCSPLPCHGDILVELINKLDS